MSSQLDLIGTTPTLKTLPSAKIKRSELDGVHAWTNFYAAYSEKFVLSAISAIGYTSKSKVLDPFVGSGTTLVCCLKLGLPAIGIDLDPFSCLLARSKVSINANPSNVQKFLKLGTRKKPLNTFSEDAKLLFDNDCLCYASTVFSRILSATNCTPESLLDTLLSDSIGKYDSEVVALTALSIGASESARLVRGSNPTWYRKALVGEKDNIEALYSSTQSIHKRMLLDIGEVAKEVPDGKRDIRIYNADITTFRKTNREKVDIIITSPPYLTRLDYVIKHLPNLLILSGVINIDINSLRKRMIGTSKIVNKEDFNLEWGKTCLNLLNLIKNHKSYASESYYVWTYSQYFSSIFNAIEFISSKLKKKGKGLIIVQNSTYKDLVIPLSEIICEMLMAKGLFAENIRQEKITRNMKFINPKLSKDDKKSFQSEDVIHYKKL